MIEKLDRSFGPDFVKEPDLNMGIFCKHVKA
jgi:hypothetical protein